MMKLLRLRTTFRHESIITAAKPMFHMYSVEYISNRATDSELYGPCSLFGTLLFALISQGLFFFCIYSCLVIYTCSH